MGSLRPRTPRSTGPRPRAGRSDRSPGNHPWFSSMTVSTIVMPESGREAFDQARVSTSRRRLSDDQLGGQDHPPRTSFGVAASSWTRDSAASAPCCRMSCRTVVSGGSISAAKSRSSNPARATSSGTRRPASRIAGRAPAAAESLAQKMASTPASRSCGAPRPPGVDGVVAVDDQAVRSRGRRAPSPVGSRRCDPRRRTSRGHR